MSTLTSTQMNVKRSSTRVHGPPGGASQLTFGPGGFGSSAPPPEPEADAELRDCGGLPQTAQQPRADFIPQKPVFTPSTQRGSTAYPINNNQNQQQLQQQFQQQRPPPTGYSYPSPSGGPPPSTSGGRGVYGGNQPPGQFIADSRPSTTGSGWGKAAQPPLTSSKRDQNWERKRRQWLARKNGGGSSGGYSSGSSFVPSTAGGGYDNPPSPLSKLLHNVNIGGSGQEFQMPPRTQQSSYQQLPQQLQPPRTSMYPDTAQYGHQGAHQQQQLPPRTQQSSSYQQMEPPRTSSSSYNQDSYRGGAPPTGYTRQGAYPDNYGKQPSNVFQNTGAAQFSQPTPQANNNRMMIGSVPSTAASGRSVRQAPGGTSNWSPYS